MKKALYSVAYMFAITLCFTSLVSGIRFLNDERIQTNNQARLQSVILDVLNIEISPDAGPEEIVNVFKKRVRQLIRKEETIYIGYDEKGFTPEGYAFAVTGPGFWGPVSCMIGISKDFSHVTGVNFYENTETPGLGARITEKWFRSQFTGLLITREKGDGTFFSLTPVGGTKGMNEFDAVTGATETSRAVEKILNSRLDHIVREIIPMLREEQS